jgi:lysophospholipase L1-like esterase
MSEIKRPLRVGFNRATRRKLFLFRIIASSLGILLSLIIAEVGLRIIEKARLGDRAVEDKLTNDPQLGRRLAPYAMGHDANGFRNDDVPQHADIVVLGDSQTWGVNVQRPDAWPQQLGRISQQRVYNMGLGGFGPVQYWVLTERALKLSPKVIVVGLYLGNDLFDAYDMAYTNSLYVQLRASNAPVELLNNDIKARAEVLWSEAKDFHNRFGRLSPRGWTYWLREHLAIGRLLNRTGWWPGSTDVDYEIDKAWAWAYPEHGSVYEGGQIRTVFTTAYRLVGLDVTDPHIAEGLRITEDLLVRIDALANARGCKVLVLLIPTKESVYAAGLKGQLGLNDTYAKLMAMETQARQELEAACAKHNISCVDALPSLSGALERREQVYPFSTDSHPNAHGYSVLASRVYDELSKIK